jgi:hypothetical protein
MDIRKPSPSGMTTVFAMVLSLLGAAMVFAPWVSVPGFGGRTPWSWQAVVNLILLITLFLFLIATSPLKPVPLWRSIALIGVAFLVLLFAGLFMADYGGRLRLEAGVYLQFVAGFGLLLIGALEIRGHLIRWQQEQHSPRVELPADDYTDRRDDPAFRERIKE